MKLNEKFIKETSDLFVIKGSYGIILQAKDFYREPNDIDIIISEKNLNILLNLKEEYKFELNMVDVEVGPYGEMGEDLIGIEFSDGSKIQIQKLNFNLYDKFINLEEKMYFKNIDGFNVLELKSIAQGKLARLKYCARHEQYSEISERDIKDLMFLYNKNLIKIYIE